MSTTTVGPKGPRKTNTAIAGSVIIYGTGVKRGADQNTLVQGTAASANLGIATDAQDTIGHAFPFAQAGEIVEGRSGAAFVLDALLTTDANGKLVTAATTNPVTAIAREAATAADQLVTVEVAPAGYKAP
jgi:hypothetical protein